MKQKNTLLRSVFIASLLLLLSQTSFSQTFPVSGKITSATGEPLAGVTVQVKNGRASAISNVDGNFQINAPSSSAVLVFSYVGFADQQIPVNGQRQLSVALAPTNTSLENVVVVGYGTQKKKDITGAVATFRAENVDERPLARVDQALVGQMAGVRVKQTSGVPGKGFSIVVRGTGSISAATEPLYVIDGFPLEVAAQNGGGGFSTGNPLDNINPNDIETIQVLKDAAAAAIYGSRASNGVVIITTKNGKVGRAKITFNTYTGTSKITKKLDVLNGDEWVDRATEYINFTWANSAAGRTADQTNEQRRVILGLPVGQADIRYMTDDRWAQPGHPGLTYVDWQDEFFRKGMVQDYQLSASGGTNNVKYYMSGDYFNQKGVAIGVGYKRYTARVNVEAQASDRLKFGINLSPSYGVTNDPNVDTKDGLTHIAVSSQPVVESVAGLQSGTKTYSYYKWGTTRVSPVAVAQAALAETRNLRTLATIYGEYTIIKGLSARTSFNFDNVDLSTKSFRPAEINDGANPTSGSFGGYNRKTIVNENTLSYNKQINGKHNITALAGYSYNYNKLSNYNIAGGTYGTNVVTVINGSLNTLTSGTTGETDDVLLSYFTRGTYSYQDKYLLTASVRRDGSSRFGANTKWGIFPQASLGWRVSAENFMKSVEVINDLKLRGSWGITGNNGIGDYASVAALGGANTSFGGAAVSGQAPSNIQNPDLSWEEAEIINVGLDATLLRNRITVAFDVYKKDNRNLLLNIPVPSITGFTTAITNIGEVVNKGWEAELNTRNITGRFEWSTSINLSHNSNVVKKLGPNNTTIENNGGFNEGHSVLMVGQPMNSLFLVQQIGILTTKDIADGVPLFPGQSAGDPKYFDANGDKVISIADRILSGDPAPKLIWGFNNTFKFKGFDLNVFIQGQHGGLIYSMFGRAMDRVGMGYQDNPLGHYRNRWRSDADPGDGTVHKTPTKQSTFIKNTDWLYSSDYWRVRNITLGYNLGNLFKNKLVSGARIYATAENYFGHDKYYGGFNPEGVNTNGEDYGAFPLSKSIIVGLNVTF